MLRGAEPAPIHMPPGATKTIEGRSTVAFAITTRMAYLFAAESELGEEEMLKKLQAELAM